MYEALLVVFLIVAIGLVGLIMLQQGKGADMGASFGAGASATLFGSSGSGNFMTRMTALLATLFFIISLVLGNINSNKTNKGSEWENLSAPAKTEQTQPAAPAKPTSDIPKPHGGVRTSGIPTVVDRLIQQAVQQAQRYIRGGKRWVVDMDLEKFFDRVDHRLLMTRLARTIKDRRVL